MLIFFCFLRFLHSAGFDVAISQIDLVVYDSRQINLRLNVESFTLN